MLRSIALGVGSFLVLLYGCGDDDSTKARNDAAAGEAAGGERAAAGENAGGASARAGAPSTGRGGEAGSTSGASGSGAGDAGASGGGETGSGGNSSQGGAPDGGQPSEAGAAHGGQASEGGAASGGAPAPGSAGAAGAAGASTCQIGEVASAGTQQNLDLFGNIVYFADGAALPAGRYRATYVDGCMKYGGGQDWTIHAYPIDAGHPNLWWFVGATTGERIVNPPGTSGYNTPTGAYATFDECVSANLALPPLEFDFAGGQIGVWLEDSPYADNMAGQDGRNPKWQLTLLEPCAP